MNTGIQDAANLAWKLALVLRGHADEGAAGSLLDSYEAERRQVALGVVSTTHRLTRLATVRSPVARRLRNALLAVAGLDGRLPRRLAANLAEVDIVYRGGWSADGSNNVGRWIPEGRMSATENQDPRLGTRVRAPGPRGPRSPGSRRRRTFSGPPGSRRADSRRRRCVAGTPGWLRGWPRRRGRRRTSARFACSGTRGDPSPPRSRRRCGRDIGEGAATPSFGKSEREQELLPWGTEFESWGRGVRFGCAHVGRRKVYWFATRNAPREGRSVRSAGPTEPGRPSLTSFERGTILSGSSSKRPPRRRYAATTCTIASPCQPAGGWVG